MKLPISSQNKDDLLNRLELSGSLTEDKIEKALRELAGLMSSARHIVIDCHDLQEIDEKGLRFLCSAHRHIVSRNRTIDIAGLSPELVWRARSQTKNFVPGFSCLKTDLEQCVWK